jgi:hypothetical protein
MWLEIDLETHGNDVRVGGRGSRGERSTTRVLRPEHGLEALQSFATKVGRAVRGSRPLDPQTLDVAHNLYDAIFQRDLMNVVARLQERQPDGRILVRLFTRDRALSDVPFEALCKPGTVEGFVGMDPRIVFARGVSSSEPWAPREVRGAVRVLAIAPGSSERSLGALTEALAPSIEAGEIEWLDPICGPEISPRVLYEKLRRVAVPHIVHFLGHGGIDANARPTLRMADDEDGEEVWLLAEAFARELSASFCDELRMVVLEACEGAKSGALGSAAQLLGRSGADAVVAHLWPVKADVARLCSMEIYRGLTGKDLSVGDIGASVAAARRTLLATSAEAFSPILYLRGTNSVIFDFDGRRVSKPASKSGTKGLAPALVTLLEKPFSMVLGDLHGDHDALKEQLVEFMKEHDDNPEPHVSLFTLTQRCMLRFGKDILHALFQQSLASALSTPPPALIDAFARLLPSGVHVTLSWRPYLERSIAEKQPQRTIYAIQPSFAASSMKPRIVKRVANSNVWITEATMPKRLDLDHDIVVLRLYSGYSAEAHPIFSQPVLTEDDHFYGLFGDGEHPAWMDDLLYRLRTRPALLIGLSIFDWRHRMLLRWLYDRAPLPKDSLALLTPETDATETETLDNGGAMAGAGRITAIIDDPQELASLVAAIDRGPKR